MKHSSRLIAFYLMLVLVAIVGIAFICASQPESTEWPRSFDTDIYPIPGGVVSYSDALPANYNTELRSINILNPSRMETGDFDEDGNLDFLMPTVFGELGVPVLIEDALQGIVTPIDDASLDDSWPLFGTWPTPLVLAFGDGDGGIREAVQLTEFTNGSFATAADLDKDGHLDIVCELAVGHPDWPAPNRPLLLLYGDGKGGFPVARYVNIDPDWFVSLGRWQVADMDGDGICDLAALGYCVLDDALSSTFGVAIYLGAEDGPYETAQRVCLNQPGLASGSLFEIIDLDGDKHLDLVAAVTIVTPYSLDPGRFSQTGYLLTLVNDGVGTLRYDSGRMIPLQPKALTTGDFNGDGVQDVVVSHFADAEITESQTRGENGEVLHDYHVFGGQSTSITAFFGNGKGGFDDGVRSNTRVIFPNVLAGDLDGNGVDDVVAISPNDARFSVLLGSPTGLSEASLFQQRSFMRWADCLGDFDNDGNLDLGALGSYVGQIETTFGDGEGGFGTGWFSPPIETQIPFAPSIPDQGGAADFDGDGHVDVLFYRDSFDTLGIAFGDGKGQLVEVVPIRFGDVHYDYQIDAVAAGDVNLDGRADIVAACSEDRYQGASHISVFLGSSERAFVEVPIETSDPVKVIQGLALGDFSCDGNMDLFVARSRSQSTSEVFPGDGEGAFGMPVDIIRLSNVEGEYDTCCSPIYVADVNEDGIADLVAESSNYYASSVDILHGDPVRGLVQVSELEHGGFYLLVGVADFNGDQHADILTASAMYVGDGGGDFERVPLGSFEGIPASDFNQDGFVDRISDLQGSLLVHLGDGEIGSQAADIFVATRELDPGFGDFTLGDFNEDGWQDIAYTAGEWLGILLAQPDRFPTLEEQIEGSQ